MIDLHKKALGSRRDVAAMKELVNFENSLLLEA
jgi:hypothetical protein